MRTVRSEFGFLSLFFVIAFGWAWLFWVPVALQDSGVVVLPKWLAAFVADGQPAAWGPLIGAMVVVLLQNGLGGMRELALSMLRVRFSLWWYIAAIAILPAIVGLAQMIAWLSGELIAASPAFEQPLSIPIAFVFIFLFAGPLQEEAGWRGTSTRLLQSRFGALWASLITGVIWGLWHLPLFFQNREEAYYNQPVFGLLISTTLLSVLHTWIYNSTKRSLFAAMLMHTSWNWANYVFTGLQTDTGGLAVLIMLTATAVMVTVRFGPRRLSGGA